MGNYEHDAKSTCACAVSYMKSPSVFVYCLSLIESHCVQLALIRGFMDAFERKHRAIIFKTLC